MTTKETGERVAWCDESPDSVLAEADARPKPLLLGLPCSRCRAYYGAQLSTCPILGALRNVANRNQSNYLSEIPCGLAEIQHWQNLPY